MPITLPDFKDKKCRDVIVCGFIEAAEFDKADLARFRPLQASLIAEYDLSGQKVFARMVPPFPLDDDEDVHLHIDFSPARGKHKPKVNSDIDEIVKTIDPFIGKKINIRLVGTFRSEIKELPSFIRPFLVEYGASDKIQIRMTGGTFSVQGAPPVEAISWRLLDEDRGADLSLETRTGRTLSESYLVDELNTLESAFKAFTIGIKQ